VRSIAIGLCPLSWPHEELENASIETYLDLVFNAGSCQTNCS